MHLAAMLCLTFVTGIVDAVGYLGLDRVFTGNMTGNVVILGMGLIGADDLPVLGPSLALVGFLIGAAVAGRVLARSPGVWNTRMTALFAVVSVVLAALGVLLLARGGEPDGLVALVVSTTLGAVMGLQAATARFLGVKDVTTVVVTSTITGLAADSLLGSGAGAGSVRRLTAVLCIFLGAVAGAALLLIDLGIALIVAGVLALAPTLLGDRHHRLSRPDRGDQPASCLIASGV
ncbi:YoaK family protein [Streptomyces malaysiensis]|uniref:YoaK family protein n=1 Tax=Streptomyces malaysiensis TaxID=92644 RepID=UPI00371E7233